MSAIPRVLSIVLNWNGATLTRRCVSSLQAASVAPDVFLVDNGSRADDREALAEVATSVSRFVQLPQNVGYAGGMNRGIRHALAEHYDFVWLVNNDAVVDRECLDVMLDVARRDHPALVSPRLESDGAPHIAGGVVRWNGDGIVTMSFGELRDVDPTWRWLSGAAMLIPTVVLDQVGPLNEKYFAYCEDVEFCLRATRHGVRHSVADAALVKHQISASTGGDGSAFSAYLMARNELHLIRQFRREAGRDGALMVRVARRLEAVALMRDRNQWPRAEPVLAGVAAALRGESGPPRRLHQTDVVVSAVRRYPWVAARFAATIAARYHD